MSTPAPDRAGAAGRGEAATEIGFPNGEVGRGDGAVAVAVGAAAGSDRLAERVAPIGVVGGVDEAIIVEVAGKADIGVKNDAAKRCG